MYFVRYEHKALAFIEKKSIIAPVDGNKRHVYYGPGCIAQLVEQLTLNQWVQGSSPCAPTKKYKPQRGFIFLSGQTGREPWATGFDNE